MVSLLRVGLWLGCRIDACCPIDLPFGDNFRCWLEPRLCDFNLNFRTYLAAIVPGRWPSSLRGRDGTLWKAVDSSQHSRLFCIQLYCLPHNRINYPWFLPILPAMIFIGQKRADDVWLISGLSPRMKQEWNRLQRKWCSHRCSLCGP